jgi:hypothetical protein
VASPAQGKPTRPWPGVGLLLLAALVIREAFSFWTGHPYDFEIWIRTGYVVAHGHNPYISFWPPVPGLSITYGNSTLPSAAYLPFWALVTGGSYNAYLAIGGGNRFVYYFLLKQGPILADVGTAYLLYWLARDVTGDERLGQRVLALWAFFPYAILISAVWGQFDPIEVVLLLLILVASTSVQRNVVYGLGIFVKWLTAIYLPFEIFRSRGVRRLGFLLGLFIPAALTLLVFLGMHWSLSGIQATATSETAGGPGGMNFVRWFSEPWSEWILLQVPYFYRILPYTWVPAVILAGWAFARRLTPGDRASELRALTGIMTVFLLFRWGLNEQYMLYLFAPMLLDLEVYHPGRRDLFLWLVGLSSIFLAVNNALGVWFLSPISPGYWTWATHEDGAPVIAPIRSFTLIILATLITVVLVQWVYVLLNDETEPRPWLLRLWPLSVPASPPPAPAAPAEA